MAPILGAEGIRMLDFTQDSRQDALQEPFDGNRSPQQVEPIVKLDGVDINGFDDLIRALDRDRIDRQLEMDVLRQGRLRAVEIHPIERRPAPRQG